EPIAEKQKERGLLRWRGGGEDDRFRKGLGAKEIATGLRYMRAHSGIDGANQLPPRFDRPEARDHMVKMRLGRVAKPCIVREVEKDLGAGVRHRACAVGEQIFVAVEHAVADAFDIEGWLSLTAKKAGTGNFFFEPRGIE